MRLVFRAVAMSVLVLALAGCSTTEGTVDDHRQLVYWPLVSDGSRHQRVAYPLEAGRLRVLAGTPFVLEARMGEVEFWPITREYLSQFDDSEGAEGFVTGDLVVTDVSGGVRHFAPTDFVESFSDGVGRSVSEILTGQEALATYQRYLDESRDALDAQRTYQEAVAAQQVEVERWLKAAAENPDNPPPAPNFELIDPPEPYLAYVSEPRKAPVLTLPAGTFEVHLLDQHGGVIVGSQRRIQSIAPTATGVGYELMPEHRWTQSERAFDPDATIYTTGEFGFYLSPTFVEAYPAADYARLLQPQLHDVPSSDDVVWIPVPSERREIAGELRVESDPDTTIPEVPYVVSPVPGTSRGYEISETADPEEADFSALYVPSNIDPGPIMLVESDGSELPTSLRTVRGFRLEQEAFLFLPAALPLAAAVALRRRRRSK